MAGGKYAAPRKLTRQKGKLRQGHTNIEETFLGDAPGSRGFPMEKKIAMYLSRKLCLTPICQSTPKEPWHLRICKLEADAEEKLRMGTREEVFSFFHISSRPLLGQKQAAVQKGG